MVKGLVLFPLKGRDILDPKNAVGTDRLEMIPDFRIFQQLRDLSGKTLKDGTVIEEKPSVIIYFLPVVVEILEKTGMAHRSIDRVGRPLTFVRASEFRRLKIPDDADQRNKAAIAFCGALEDGIPIVLYWL